MKIKDRNDSEQRLNYGHPFGANATVVAVDDLSLKVKKEIKEELEQAVRSSNFDDLDHTLEGGRPATLIHRRQWCGARSGNRSVQLQRS